MPKWKDKKDFNTNEVKSSEITLGRFRLIVHKHIAYPPDVWLASCGGLFVQVNLASKDLGKAKEEAKAKLRLILERSMNDIDES